MPEETISSDQQISQVAALLEDVLGQDGALIGEPLAAHTTFEIGGPADVFAMPASVEQAVKAVAVCVEAKVPWRIMGRGSDLLVSDGGLRGVVVQLAERFSGIQVQGETIVACAGASNEQVAQAALEAGLAGYEFASGIPGSIGGAAIMNAGAYGGEFKDVAVELLCLDRAGGLRRVLEEEADWGYRHSMMSDAGMVVLQATLRLSPDDPAAIRARMDELEAKRADKQPLEMPSAGSTFKRPEGYFAGKLIQDAGLQGLRVGGAEVSRKHAGFVVNAGGATAADVRALIEEVQQRVHTQFGVMLEPEVRMWGFDEAC